MAEDGAKKRPRKGAKKGHKKGSARAVAFRTSDFAALGPRLHEAVAGHYGAAAAFCLRQHHSPPTLKMLLSVEGSTTALRIAAHELTPSMNASFADLQESTEYGAYGIALLASAHVFQFRFGQRSSKGTGFDMFMLPPGAEIDPEDPFSETWGLEATGILQGDDKAIRDRFQRKRNQIMPSIGLVPILIAVVEFSAPTAIFEQH